MADTKLSALPTAAAVDWLYGEAAGASKKIAPGNVGGSTITLTAGTDLAAGTAVSIDSSGHAVQTWGPAPNVASLVPLLAGNPLKAAPYDAAILILSATQFIVFDSTDAAANGAQACSISGSTITCGSIDVSVPSKNAMFIGYNPSVEAGIPAAAPLTGNLFVAAYIDPTSQNLNIAAGSVSANVISYGSPVQVIAQGATYAQMIKLSASSFAILTKAADNTVQIAAGTVSGTAITLGTPITVAAAQGAGLPTFAALSSSAVLVSYSDGNSGNIGTAVVVSVSGTTCTLNTPQTAPGSSGAVIAVLTPTSFVLTDFTRLFAASISGTTISFGSPVSIGFLNTAINIVPYSSILPFNTTQFILQASALGSPRVGTVSGTTITSLTDPEYLGGQPSGISDDIGTPLVTTAFAYVPAAVLSSSLFIFADSNFSIYEGDNTGVVSGRIDHQLLAGYWLYPLSSTQALALLVDQQGKAFARLINAQPINTGPVGFTAAAVSSGNPATISFTGPVSGFSGLTPGAQYYVNGDGTVTTANTGHPAGVALSATTLLAA